MSLMVGEIAEIRRYPVKSFAGEQLEHCEIEPHGMRGDRLVSFRDDSKEGWHRYVTARNMPNMLKYKAQFVDGDIRVTGPDGRSFGWDEELRSEIQSQSRAPIRMTRRSEPHPEIPRLLSVDGSSLLLVTDASLRRLEERWGKPLDPRRFRANFLVRLREGAPFEGDWIGKRLTVGGAELRGDELCERCVMITMDPDTQEKDPTLLRKVNEEFGLRFGLYASVVRSGTVRLGDSVMLQD